MAFIMEDSDHDSIATNTTEESEHDEDHEFNVEEILAEDTNEHDERIYLVKWEGYPLHRGTWEPGDAFNGDFHLQIWRAKKAAAKRGGPALFDLDEFHEAVENAAERKQERARRRQIKRRKRNEGLSRSQSPVKPSTSKAALPRRQSAASPVKKKGVAQKVVKKASKSTEDETRSAKTATAQAPKPKPKSDTNEAAAPSKSTQPARKSAPSGPSIGPPLMGPNVPEMKRRQNPRVSGETPKDSTAARFRNLSTQNRFQNYSRNAPPPDKSALTMIDLKTGKPLSAPKQAQSPTEPVKQASVSNAAAPERRQSQPELERQISAPATSQTQQKANPTPSTSLRRPSEPTNPEVPKTPAHPEPIRRATIAEVPETAAQSGPARRPVEPVPTTSTRASEIHSAYGRRTPPAEKRRRSPSPPPPQPVATTVVPPRKLVTCRNWQSGSCPWTAEKCWFRHGYDGEPGQAASYGTSKKATTCYYWGKLGNCVKTAEECSFAHEYTGTIAGAPGSFLDSVRKASTEQVNQTPVNYERRQQIETAMPTREEPFQQGRTAPPTVQAAPNFVEEDSALPMDSSPMLDDAVALRKPGTGYVGPNPRTSIAEDLSLAGKSVDKLDMSTILSKNGKHIENVYVLMPPERNGERELLVNLFTKFKCKVFDSGTPQHWNFFKSFNESVVIIHPSETFNGSLPGFASYMLRKRVWVFSIGVHETWDEADQPVRMYEAKRVFPHGIMTFISDDIFVYYPEKATEVIQAFHKKAQSKPKGGEISKIGARPGIRGWLADLAAKKIQEGGEESEGGRYVECYDALCELCPLEDYDPWEMEMGHMVPKEEALLWSVAEQDLPSFQGLWEKDEARATDMMANFFAGSAVEKMADFQRYCFIYQRPDQEDENMEVPASQLAPQEKIDQVDPKGWMRRYNHVKVMSADEWLYMHKRKLQEQQMKV